MKETSVTTLNGICGGSGIVHQAQTSIQDFAQYDGKSFFDTFEKFVWQSKDAQIAVKAAIKNDTSFPECTTELIYLWPNGRWPLYVNITNAVKNLTKATPPKRPRFRQKRVGIGTGWMGADVVANVKTKNGSPGRPAKPETSKAAYALLFSRYNILTEYLRNKELLAVGRPPSGNREHISAIDWSHKHCRHRVSIQRNALTILKGKRIHEIYGAIELELPKVPVAQKRPGRKPKYPWQEATVNMKNAIKNGKEVKSLADMGRLLIDCIADLGCDDFPEPRSAERYLNEKENDYVQATLSRDKT